MKEFLRRIARRLRPSRPDMARDWERRVRENPLHYIADFREQWDNLDEFFLTGRHDVDKLLAQVDWPGAEMVEGRILEIGCGVGRMSRHLAAHFREVVGIDISPTMIRRAKELNDSVPNVRFEVNSGSDLAGFADNSFDYVLSYIVFQHIPSEEIIANYLREALRVLKPGGRFLFQARNMPPVGETDTYNGAEISVERVRAIAAEAGRMAAVLDGEGTLFCYFEIS